MDLNKAVPPWRRKSWKKRYSNTMRLQNEAKLAAGAHRGHVCFGKAYEQVPALICDSYACRILRAAAFWGGYFANRKKNDPPKYLRDKYEIAHPNSIIPKKFATPPGQFPLFSPKSD